MRICDFLLVRNSNLGPPYLALFRSYDSFYVLLTPPLLHPNFGGVPVAPDRPCWCSQSKGLKLFGREVIFEIFQPV